MIDIKKLKKVHFTGIKGVGMTAVALCLKDLGIEITGSDIKEYFVTDKTLKNANIKWFEGFSRKHFDDAEALIYTASHGGDNNIEVIEAKKRHIPTLSQGQALGLLMNSKIGISVAGVGGKTTTSGMIATILNEADLNPSWVIGAGSISPLGNPGRYNKLGQYFIAEADEYISSWQDKTPKFMYQNPKIIVLTNIEYDHPDVYKNIDETLNAFKKFLNKLPKDGWLVVNIDNKNILKILRNLKVKYFTYGKSRDADFRIENINTKDNILSFDICYKNKHYKDISIPILGEFNAYNASAAFATTFLLGMSLEQIKKGLKSYMGAKRRFEFIANIGKIDLYDDYAHHPSEILATLKACRQKFQDRKIIVIFQPHTYSRTKQLFNDFVKAFNNADWVIITPIYVSAREKIDDSISSEKLAKGILPNNKNVLFVKDVDQLLINLNKILIGNEVIITMGAGDIFLWHTNIIKNFQPKADPVTWREKIIRDKALAPLTTFRVGGKADYFIEVNNKEEIIEAVKWANICKLPFIVIGGGSNILISDKGYRGMVIKIQNTQPKADPPRAEKFRIQDEYIECPAGLVTSKLLEICRKNSLSGLEFLLGIPGTVGGAIYGNAGTDAKSIASYIEEVMLVNRKGEIYNLKKSQCKFNYRQSIFQETKDVIISAKFKLIKADLKTINKIYNQYLITRKNQPKGKSAGSIFKNPKKYNAGYLIEKSGLKGFKIGNAAISTMHANWIINEKNAKAKDIFQLIELIKKKIKEKYNIKLEEEINILGDFND